MSINNLGSYISIIGVGVFLINLLYAFIKKKAAEKVSKRAYFKFAERISQQK